ncbi:ATP-binding protein [Streptomyces sp. 8N706]|uniref:ATP-binding protein n=1 Tax=Streptomyces sp. 8N706 TaxID=3457416 RepID=UPI003FD308B3
MATARFLVTGVPCAVAPARRRILATAHRWLELGDELADAVEVVTSELLTNAVVHAGGVISVGLLSEAGRLLIEVFDGSPDEPRARPVSGEDETGRGLELVALLSANCGWEPTPRGKKVWAEFHLVPKGSHADDRGSHESAQGRLSHPNASGVMRSEARAFLTRLSDARGTDGVTVVRKSTDGADVFSLADPPSPP